MSTNSKKQLLQKSKRVTPNAKKMLIIKQNLAVS